MIRDDDECIIEATVVSGFEEVSAEEVKEKLSVDAEPLYDDYETFKGHLYFPLSESSVPHLTRLQTVDNLYVLATEVFEVEFPDDDVYACLKLIRLLPTRVNWTNAWRIWQSVFIDKYTDYHISKTSGEIGEFLQREPEEEWWPNVSGINPRLEKKTKKIKSKKGKRADVEEREKEEGRETKDVRKWKENEEEIVVETSKDNARDSTETAPPTTSDHLETSDTLRPLKVKDPNLPTFRATCNRGQPSGDKHAFTSQDAAKVFGGAIQSAFLWNVDMTEYDVEVVLNISGSRVWITFALTQESLHKRHIKHFGPTTLRSTIAMNLLKFSGLGEGETVCDPMCGGGGIPIEAAYEWPNVNVVCGDNHEQAFQRAVDNIAYNNEKLVAKNSLRRELSIEVFRWDVTALPLREETIDVFVTDLPFGKRSGTKVENRVLYPKILNEMARVAKRESGRAVFLTEDKNGFFRAMEANQFLWWKKKHLWINIGGMWGGVFLLQRNAIPWRPMNSSKNSLKQNAKRKRKLETKNGKSDGQ